VIGGAIISFGILIMAIQATGTHTTQVNVARIVSSVLMLLLSMGIIKLAIGYSSLGKNSTRSEAAAERALETTPDELGAFKVISDYHLSRAVGPIIPTWIWRLREKNLNQTWKELRNGTET
jgi:formate/nitrite transporter FocA (FNT family)